MKIKITSLLLFVLHTHSINAQKNVWFNAAVGYSNHKNEKRFNGLDIDGVNMEFSSTIQWHKNMSASFGFAQYSLHENQLNYIFVQNRSTQALMLLYHFHTSYDKHFILDLGFGPHLKFHKWNVSASNDLPGIVYNFEMDPFIVEPGTILYGKEVSIGLMLEGGYYGKVSERFYPGLKVQYQNDNWKHSVLTYQLAAKFKL